MATQQRDLDDIDLEAERVFAHVRRYGKIIRYRNVMDTDPETRWNEAMKRVLENER